MEFSKLPRNLTTFALSQFLKNDGFPYVRLWVLQSKRQKLWSAMNLPISETLKLLSSLTRLLTHRNKSVKQPNQPLNQAQKPKLRELNVVANHQLKRPPDKTKTCLTCPTTTELWAWTTLPQLPCNPHSWSRTTQQPTLTSTFKWWRNASKSSAAPLQAPRKRVATSLPPTWISLLYSIGRRLGSLQLLRFRRRLRFVALWRARCPLREMGTVLLCWVIRW